MSFVLVGPSGVGKTHISESIVEDLKALLSTPQRTYQTRKVSVEAEDCTLIFFDTPGHKAGEAERNDGINVAAQHGNYGLILVAAYGYHESVSMERPPSDIGSGLQDWLSQKRSLEFNTFQTVVHRSMIVKRPAVIITLVNKADLWNDEWSTVKLHYEEASFHEEATTAGVQHEVVKYCVMPQKFWQLNNIPLKVDANEAKILHRRLLDLLRQFALE